MTEAAIHWKRAEAGMAGGRAEEALADFAASAEIYELEGARPNLARVLRGSGAALRAVGRREDGDALLRRSLDVMEALGLAREADEVRSELAA